MLFRTSISNTKKLFQKTIKTFKSFLSGGYERLPKTPPFNPFSCRDDVVDLKFTQNYKELDKFYSDFSDRWDDSSAGKDKAKKRSKKKTVSSPTSSPMKKSYREEIRDDHEKKKRIVYEGKRKAEELSSCPQSVIREGGSSGLVAQKMKELEMLDISNVEHVLDIEEVLHYYSRLTCPAYLDIVDKFFMDMYAELFTVHTSTHSNHSRPMLKW